jgi:hypothetical protein
MSRIRTGVKSVWPTISSHKMRLAHAAEGAARDEVDGVLVAELFATKGDS